MSIKYVYKGCRDNYACNTISSGLIGYCCPDDLCNFGIGPSTTNPSTTSPTSGFLTTNTSTTSTSSSLTTSPSTKITSTKTTKKTTSGTNNSKFQKFIILVVPSIASFYLHRK
jgi:hypothetical protein